MRLNAAHHLFSLVGWANDQTKKVHTVCPVAEKKSFLVFISSNLILSLCNFRYVGGALILGLGQEIGDYNSISSFPAASR
jgi:hypothetical protein